MLRFRAGIKAGYELALRLCKGHVIRQLHPIGRLHSVTLHQKAVELRLDPAVAGNALPTVLLHQGMAVGIQRVMAKDTIQIRLAGFRGIQPQIPACPGEKLLSGLPVKFISQSADLCAEYGFIKEKQVRPVEAYIKHTPMALCRTGYICGHFSEHCCSEAVMGIGGWH